MKKIAYNAPEMELMDLKMTSAMLVISNGGGDPAIHTGEDNVPGDDEVVIDD